MDVIVHSGCALMVSLFNGKPGDSLSAVRYICLCKNVYGQKLGYTRMTVSNIFGYKVSFSEKLSPGNATNGPG